MISKKRNLPFKIVDYRGEDKIIVDYNDFKKIKKLRFRTLVFGNKMNTVRYIMCGDKFLHQIVLGNKFKNFIVKFKNRNTLDCRKENIILKKRKVKKST